MQRTKQDISALIEKGETFHLECKKAQGGLPCSLWESYSVFCNTDNKTLQKMFQFLGYSEKAGSGFPKIFMGTDEQHWERPTLREDFQLDQTYLNMPTVDLTDDSFQPEGGVKGGVKTTPITAPITTPITTPNAIIALIRENSTISAAQMAKSLGLTRDGIRYHLDRMKAEGVIRFVGTTRNGHWELVQKPFQTTIANERSEPKVD